MEFTALRGEPFPLGASYRSNGSNFSVFVESAQAVELIFFDHQDAAEPTAVFNMHQAQAGEFAYWHAFIPGVPNGQRYAYRVIRCGEHPGEGAHFLLDPYTKAVAISHNGQRALSIVVDDGLFDWDGDTPLHTPERDMIIYEMHVSGLTKNPNSDTPPHVRGTYTGVIHKIPYLKSLGVTAIELMPVQQFDDGSHSGTSINYWGYNPIAFFAPHAGYGSANDPLAAREEFKSMVKAFHDAGIEVILDVVFNHTAEGNHCGYTQSFKGLSKTTYYMLERDMRHYKNYSGCGNTLNTNHAVVRRMIVDCLKSWVLDMHIDGFRFDLASIFSRAEDGRVLSTPPIIWDIETDPVLSRTKIIAEPWDAAGLYQVGHFAGHRWMEWNGKYRDDIRRYIKGELGMVSAVASRLTGSADIFPKHHNAMVRSVNFVTCHDGFTLNDLVSYNHKHNAMNGEHNRDGAHQNDSWNCGVEGDTQCPATSALRLKQSKNLLALLLLSQGTPMLLMGDEAGRTQLGNNNAYCQDNALSWFDWDRAKQYNELFLFVQTLTRLRKKFITHACARDDAGQHVIWHGVEAHTPDWSPGARTLAFELFCACTHETLYVATNAYWEPVHFSLPAGAWSLAFSTDGDFTMHRVTGGVRVPARSIIALLREDSPGGQ